MKINKVRQLIYWSYANLAMAHSAVAQGKDRYSGVNFMIRSRLYKGLIDGKMNIRSMFDDEKVKLLSSNRCCYCGVEEKLAIDHLIPQFLGGNDSSDNFVYACKTCNSSKGKKDMMEWMTSKGKFPPLMVLRRYLKLVHEYCSENELLDYNLEEMENIYVPFKQEFIPIDFPQPEKLVLIASQK